MSQAIVAQEIPAAEAAHSPLGPSGANTWVNCPGAIQAQEGYPNKSSEFAAEGTAAHEVAAWALEEGKPAADLIGQIITVPGSDGEAYTFTVDADMAEHVQSYIDYVLNLEGEVTAVEQRVYTPIPECYGTADYIAWSPSTLHLDVADLKFGRGIKVFAKDNLQEIIYAWGAIRGLSKNGADLPVTITLHIGQPRLGHFDSHTYTLLEIQEHILQIYPAALRALDLEDVERIPGEKQCQWCRAKADCTELLASVQSAVVVQFPVEVEQPPMAVPDLAAAMDLVDLAKGWIKAVEGQVFDQLSRGQEVPGYKLVEGRSIRQWGQSEEATKTLLRKKKMLVRDITEPRLLSVAQLEKKLGKKAFKEKFEDLVTKPVGKPSVAKASDKRPAINPSEQFEILPKIESK